jgi:hypothetical protein
LTIEFANTPLSQFQVSYQPDKKHFRQITDPRRFETQYRSPQLDLWEAGAVEWQLVRRLPARAARGRRAAVPPALAQLPLFPPAVEA